MDWIDECRELCKQVKYLGEPTGWFKRPEHVGSLRATCSVLDESRTTIAGLSLQCEYRLTKLQREEMSYGLLFRKGSNLYRVFFLDIHPKWMRSHRDKKLLKDYFGPHIHLGDGRIDQLVRQVECGITDALDPQWIERFRRHARVLNDSDNIITGPFENNLFN